MNYAVYNSNVNTLYQNWIYTNDDWIVFDISENTTIMLIGSYELGENKFTGNTKKVITITENEDNTLLLDFGYFDNREDTITFDSSTCYQMVTNIQDAPTQTNSIYETTYKTYDICFTILVALCFAFLFNFVRGLIPICKRR